MLLEDEVLEDDVLGELVDEVDVLLDVELSLLAAVSLVVLLPLSLLAPERLSVR